ncbi:DUF4019 domain-containing protein [Massilia sp. PAMC28688]|uniref:DUF4019 domain-containing protein n=1 Tax=Massilia sp. PAMC28688 TaxID=2861283 RepID=UPI001C6349DC|nr:DUF4019 domain-containing protein [Massilia sp. PAMC28688]QYF94473.1 DUF4019 domain-containing protein [Massilia sp. PAMC28688]
MTCLLRCKFLVLLALLMALAACSMSADTSVAEGEIPGFHIMFNEKNFASIYDASGEALKESASKKDFTAFLDGVHRKLGVTVSSKPHSKSVNYQPAGTFVTLVYSTQYAKGEAVEQFVYKLDGDNAILYGYHVHSNAFVMQ